MEEWPSKRWKQRTPAATFGGRFEDISLSWNHPGTLDPPPYSRHAVYMLYAANPDRSHPLRWKTVRRSRSCVYVQRRLLLAEGWHVTSPRVPRSVRFVGSVPWRAKSRAQKASRRNPQSAFTLRDKDATVTLGSKRGGHGSPPSGLSCRTKGRSERLPARA